MKSNKMIFKIIIYVMVAAMLLSILSFGISSLI